MLRRWCRNPVDADVTVVADERLSAYSGMIPGVIAGDYQAGDATIDAAALVHRAGARFVQARACRVDPATRRIELDDGSSLPWDIASLDVGSTLRGIDRPGIRAHTLALHPLAGIVGRIDQGLTRARASSPRIAVVGAGPAGVEIAFTLQTRLQRSNRSGKVLLVCRSEGLLPSYPQSAQRLVLKEAESRGLEILMAPEVRFADSEGVGFESGHLHADLVLWATGPAAPDLIRKSPLLPDEGGFVRVRSTLEVVGEDGLFAAGDCASVDGWPSLAKAGVQAVRQAPVLEANLRAALAGGERKIWYPQHHFLSLLSFGQRRAMAVRWDLAIAGHLAWRLKDRIDRAFVNSFRLPAAPERADAPKFRA